MSVSPNVYLTTCLLSVGGFRQFPAAFFWTQKKTGGRGLGQGRLTVKTRRIKKKGAGRGNERGRGRWEGGREEVWACEGERELVCARF
jgi:hypothetical protein